MEEFLITENNNKRDYYQKTNQKINYIIPKFDQYQVTPEEAVVLKNIF